MSLSADRRRKISAKSFGLRVADRRMKLGLSQAMLGEIIGVPQQTIHNWENGDVRRCGWVVELARALHTTPEWLQLGEGKPSTAASDAAEEMLDVLRLVAADQLANLSDVLARNVRDVIAKAEGRAA